MINPQKLHQELLASNLPVDGIHDNGDIDWSRWLTQDERTLVDSIIANHDPIEIILPGIDDRLAAIEDAMLAQILGGL